MSVLVLDIGTTSMRGILYDHQGHKLSVCQLPNRVLARPDGWVTEPAADWEENTVRIIQSIISDSRTDKNEIEAVAISSQRSSIIPVDREGKPLMDAIMWQDTRNKKICDELEQYNAECFRRTGSFVNSVFSGTKMTWVRRECPDLYSQVYKFVNIPEFINLKMTGEYSSDYTYASRSGLMNLVAKDWDPEMLRIYEVDREKLCTLYEPGSIVGRVSSQFEQRTGLPAGTPVIHCGGDQQCAAIGQGVTEEGNISIVLGTGAFLIAASCSVPENLTADVICNASSIRDNYILEANVLACSAAFDWFAHQMYGMEEIDYQFLEQEMIRNSRGTDCLVIPYFEGRGAPDWNAGTRAAFTNVSLGTTRGEMLTSMMEGIFMEIANHIDNISKYVKAKEVYVSGGMAANKTIVQMLTDVLGRKIIIPEDSETTAFGAYMIAMTGLGHYKSAGEAYGLLTKNALRQIYLPDLKRYDMFVKKRQAMNSCYENNREFTVTWK